MKVWIVESNEYYRYGVYSTLEKAKAKLMELKEQIEKELLMQYTDLTQAQAISEVMYNLVESDDGLSFSIYSTQEEYMISECEVE